MILTSWFRVSIVDVINFVFLAINIILYFFTVDRTPYSIHLFFLYLLSFALILFAGRLRGKKASGLLLKVVFFAYPIIFLFLIFESFFMILPYFNSLRYDDMLIRIDYAMMGVHPTIWIERWIEPWLTDLMYGLYLFYFPMPLIILGRMLRKEKYREIEEAFFIFLACYYVAYAVYFFIPASGPRFNLEGLQTVGLEGHFLTTLIRGLINVLEPNKLDAFPSLHSAILLITMLIVLKHEKKMFYFFITPAIGITISLVYCRYHYVIDIIAGFLLAGISYKLSSKIHYKYGSRFTPHFGILCSNKSGDNCGG